VPVAASTGVRVDITSGQFGSVQSRVVCRLTVGAPRRREQRLDSARVDDP
jgi:hypothetical protein